MHGGRTPPDEVGDVDALDRASVLCEATPGVEFHGRLLDRLANIAAEQGEYERAKALWDRGVEVSAALGVEAVAWSRVQRAWGAYSLGELDRMTELATDALSYIRTTGATESLVDALGRNRFAAVWRGELTKATEFQTEQDALLEKLRSPRAEMARLRVRARLHFAYGDYGESAPRGAAVAGHRPLGALGSSMTRCSCKVRHCPDRDGRGRVRLSRGRRIYASFHQRAQVPEAAARAA